MTGRTEVCPGLPEKEYRAHAGLSYSELKQLAGMVPAACKAYREQKREVTPAMTFGTLFHLAVLEPNRFEAGLSHSIKPDGMNFATKDGKLWKEINSELPILKSHGDLSVGAIDGMRASLLEMPEARRVLEWRGTNEAGVFAYDEELGLQLKCRPDKMSEDDAGRPVFIDLKTTDDPTWFEKSAVAMGYHLQDALYCRIAKMNSIDPLFIFVVVGTSAPYPVRVGTISPEARRRAQISLENLLATYSQLSKLDHWPSYKINPDLSRVGLEEFNLLIRE